MPQNQKLTATLKLSSRFTDTLIVMVNANTEIYESRFMREKNTNFVLIFVNVSPRPFITLVSMKKMKNRLLNFDGESKVTFALLTVFA